MPELADRLNKMAQENDKISRGSDLSLSVNSPATPMLPEVE